MSNILYAAPGACSGVPMMALEEAGADLEVDLERVKKSAHMRPDDLAQKMR